MRDQVATAIALVAVAAAALVAAGALPAAVAGPGRYSPAVPTSSSIQAATAAAIARYGARRVLVAAERAQAGQHSALVGVELLQAAGNLPALMLVQRLALGALTPHEAAQADAEAVLELARIGARPAG